jgi:phosphatidylserine/phosphatidylglycerophosphate/cardiolipin synthase-like enzyme
MGKGPVTFKEADITRAFKAARKAGVDVRVQIDLANKTVTLTPFKPVETNDASKAENNEWDQIFDGKDKSAIRQ